LIVATGNANGNKLARYLVCFFRLLLMTLGKVLILVCCLPSPDCRLSPLPPCRDVITLILLLFLFFNRAYNFVAPV